MPLEEEILYGIRGFGATQDLFTGTPLITFLSNPIKCSWYGTEINQNRGAFCLVQEGAELDNLVGEFVRITYKQREITLYCLAETPEIDTPIAITRRAWSAIERLSLDEIFAYVQVIR